MSNEDGRFDRRSVLKATGTALASGTVLAGAATAAKYYYGQGVSPTATLSTYTEACPTPDYPDGPTVYETKTYYVADYCDELSTGEEFYLLAESEYGPGIGWLEEEFLESA